MYYINLYFIGSLLGYIIETLLKCLFFHSMNNGILYGPWIPIYGFGIIITVLITNKIFNANKSNLNKVILSFILLVIIITTLEEVGGILIELIINKVFWKYDRMPLNIGHYISIEISLLWGLLSLLFVYYLKPFIDIFINKIPRVVTLSILLLHIIDIIFTWLI